MHQRRWWFRRKSRRKSWPSRSSTVSSGARAAASLQREPSTRRKAKIFSTRSTKCSRCSWRSELSLRSEWSPGECPCASRARGSSVANSTTKLRPAWRRSRQETAVQRLTCERASRPMLPAWTDFLKWSRTTRPRPRLFSRRRKRKQRQRRLPRKSPTLETSTSTLPSSNRETARRRSARRSSRRISKNTSGTSRRRSTGTGPRHHPRQANSGRQRLASEPWTRRTRPNSTCPML
mmetsp:Transcript_516/g.1767  ORF Transcript_516/g.1767 Transcript_516/m.1767 type:complete len:235 (-) Transcript_516:901-1605(-)